MASGSTTPRSRSRAKRSTTNLADLRLAPLSKQYEPTKGDVPPKSPAARTPYDAEEDASFARQHSSYLQGKSAPTTPGILSRSNSRRHLGGGLSRKNSLYDNDVEYDAEGETGYTYAAASDVHAFNQNRGRAEYGSGLIPKAKSEAAIAAQQRAEMAAQRLAGPGVPLSRRYRYGGSRGRRSGAATPKPADTDTWLTHTGSTASMLVKEDKGQSWLSSRQSATNLAPPSSSEDDDDDDHYEEMAALSSTTAKLHLAQYDGGSPVSQRASRWGSRYGSRPVSRKTSRLASPVGSRTPRRSDQPSYFDYPIAPLTTTEQGFVSPEEKRNQDDEVEEDLDIEKLSGENSYGLGNLVDRIMHFNLFSVNETVETTDDEAGYQVSGNETAVEAQRRMEAEAKRRKEEKDRLTSQAPPAPLGDGGKAQGEVSGWQDASWLLSVASKVIMN